MTLRHRQQPARSRLCGQACVAILTGVTLHRAVQEVSAGRRRKTSEHDLRRSLAKRDLVLGLFTRVRPADRLDNVPTLGMAAIARIRTNAVASGGGYHWIVFDRTMVYDPVWRNPIDRPIYWRYLRHHRLRVTSIAEVYRLKSAKVDV